MIQWRYFFADRDPNHRHLTIMLFYRLEKKICFLRRDAFGNAAIESYRICPTGIKMGTPSPIPPSSAARKL
jgi:hypothetical protein